MTISGFWIFHNHELFSDICIRKYYYLFFWFLFKFPFREGFLWLWKNQPFTSRVTNVLKAQTHNQSLFSSKINEKLYVYSHLYVYLVVKRIQQRIHDCKQTGISQHAQIYCFDYVRCISWFFLSRFFKFSLHTHSFLISGIEFVVLFVN